MPQKIIITALALGALCTAGAAFAQTNSTSTTPTLRPLPVSFPIAALGGCETKDACKAYCDITAHRDACYAYAQTHGLMTREQIAVAKKLQAAIGPGGCRGEECKNYCEDTSHAQVCIVFAQQNGFISKDDADKRLQLMRFSSTTRPLPPIPTDGTGTVASSTRPLAPADKPRTTSDNGNGQPTCTISINGKPAGTPLPTVTAGDTITLSWSSKNADSASWQGLTPTESAKTQGTRTFTVPVTTPPGIWSQGIAFVNNHGTAFCHAEAKIVYGANVTTASGYGSTTIQKNYPPPTCTETADKRTIQVGDSVTITWSSTNADYGINNDSKRLPTSGSEIFTNVQSSRTFNLIFYGPGGSVGCVVTVTTPGFTPGAKGESKDIHTNMANVLSAVGAGIGGILHFFGL